MSEAGTAVARVKEESLERRGLSAEEFRVLQQIVWPNPNPTKIPQDDHDKAVLMAVDYCKARGLDPFKKPLHIVPQWSTAAGRQILSFWPGLNDYRITAFRTAEFAGKEPTTFGPTVVEEFGPANDKIRVEYPSWAQVMLYRFVRGERCPFPGPKVYWKETYATASNNTTKPNAIWAKRPFGQIEKCAEAAALRAAFPEELGARPTAEEMEAKPLEPGYVDAEFGPVSAVEGEEKAREHLEEESEIAEEMAAEAGAPEAESPRQPQTESVGGESQPAEQPDRERITPDRAKAIREKAKSVALPEKKLMEQVQIVVGKADLLALTPERADEIERWLGSLGTLKGGKDA